MPALGVVQARDKLKPQHEPHWLKLSSGCYLGFRKLTPTSIGTWLARFRDDKGKQQKRSFGDYSEMPASQRYDAAKRAAEKWFEHLGKGGTAENVTVRIACERYVKHVRADRGDKPADDLDMRFKRWVFSNDALAALDLVKLNKTRIEAWRSEMAKTPVVVNRDKREVPVTRPRSAASVNRDIAALRAALNFAHDAGSVTTDMAWRVALRPSKNADGRRDVYLDRDQRRSLIECARPRPCGPSAGPVICPLATGRPGCTGSRQLRFAPVGSQDRKRQSRPRPEDQVARCHRHRFRRPVHRQASAGTALLPSGRQGVEQGLLEGADQGGSCNGRALA